jgi:effector-binding domain-containing protein
VSNEALAAVHVSPPEIIEMSSQHTAFIHLVVPRNEMQKVFGPTMQELIATLTAQSVTPQGGSFAHHLKMSPDIFDFELGFVVAAPFKPTARVKAGMWIAGKAAHAIYAGGYEGLPNAWGAFTKWMQAEKLAQAPDLWEHYVLGPHTSPDASTWRTHLYRPLTA